MTNCIRCPGLHCDCWIESTPLRHFRQVSPALFIERNWHISPDSNRWGEAPCYLPASFISFVSLSSTKQRCEPRAAKDIFNWGTPSRDALDSKPNISKCVERVGDYY